MKSLPEAPKSRFLAPSSLRRITTSGGYIPEIDGLRFVAILVVVLYHVPIQIAIRSQEEVASNPFWQLIGKGSRGVELFFLISGFILGLPFAAHLLKGKKAVRLGQYYLRRVTRLEPPYMLVILLRLPLLIVVMHKALRDTVLHGVATLLYMHGFVFGRGSTISPPTWSLEIEIQFYCLAPLFAWSYFSLRPVWLRRLAGFLFIIAAGVLQTHFLILDQESRLTLSILNYVQYFFSGFILCDLFLVDWDRIPKHWAWDAISALAWSWIFVVEGNQMHILLPLVTLVAYVGAFKGVLFRGFFRLTWISLVGGMCYSIYLTHGLAIAGTDVLLRKVLASPRINEWEGASIAFAVSILASFAVGLVLYVLIERPCMDKDWPVMLWRRLRNRDAVNM